MSKFIAVAYSDSVSSFEIKFDSRNQLWSGSPGHVHWSDL